jgi:hypothetical protein
MAGEPAPQRTRGYAGTGPTKKGSSGVRSFVCPPAILSFHFIHSCRDRRGEEGLGLTFRIPTSHVHMFRADSDQPMTPTKLVDQEGTAGRLVRGMDMDLDLFLVLEHQIRNNSLTCMTEV